jgi:hypothetical protein
MAYRIATDGTVTKVIGLKRKKQLTLDQSIASVGGTPERVRFRYRRGETLDCQGVAIKITDKTLMVVHGEGRILGLPKNPIGCALYGSAIHGEPIVGPILLAEDSEIE